jgi:hypothetical protein
MAVGVSPRDASLGCFPWDHEGSWLPASRERGCPFALLAMTIRPHECRFQGQRGPPHACLAGAMSPDERRKKRHTWLLHARCLDLSCHRTVRLAPRDVPFGRSRTTIMPDGSTHETTGSCSCAGGGYRSRDHRHLSGGGAHPSGVRDLGLRVKGSPFQETGPGFTDIDALEPKRDASIWGEGFVHAGIWSCRCRRCASVSTGRYRRSGSSMTPWGMKPTGKRAT